MECCGACALVWQCDGEALRLMSRRTHHQGVAQAAHVLRKESTLTNRTYKRLIALDNAHQIVRHMTAASSHRLVRELRGELFIGERLGGAGTSDCEEEQDIISRFLAEFGEDTTEEDSCGTPAAAATMTRP